MQLATLWHLVQPFEEAVMFTHILGEDGTPIAQADRLDAPGLYWQEGDFLIQLHQLDVPEDVVPGEYPLIILPPDERPPSRSVTAFSNRHLRLVKERG